VNIRIGLVLLPFYFGCIAATNDSKNVADHLAELLQSKQIYPAGFPIWSITVMEYEPNGTADLYVRIASAPIATTNRVCEITLTTYRLISERRLWTEVSRQQGLKEIGERHSCDYMTDVNEFHKVTGGTLSPSDYQAIISQLDMDSSILNSYFKEPLDWRSDIIQIQLNDKGKSIAVDLLDRGCSLEINFSRNADGSMTMNELSQNDVACTQY